MPQLLQHFLSRSDGSLATWTAVAAFPLTMAAALAIDMQSATTHRSDIQNAADAAVLAAALHGGLSVQEKEGLAKRQFFDGYSGDTQDILDVRARATGNRVDLEIDAKFPSKLSYFTSVANPTFTTARSAETTAEDTICVLALNPDARASVTIDEEVRFSAESCSVQANSSHTLAMLNQSRFTPVAKGFCATGGTSGSFAPEANSECAPVADPYADLPPPQRGTCEPETKFKDVLRNRPGDDDGNPFGPNPALTNITLSPVLGTLLPEHVPLDLDDSPNVVVDLEILTPGTYCGGLTLAGRDVRMLPGEYIMQDGPFVVKDGATVQADGVLVALSGKKAKLKVEDGGSIDITAPATGPRAGIAIMEDTTTKEKDKMRSTIRDGAMSLTGTLYLPRHDLEIKGGASNVGAQAPATSFIVDTISIMGSGTVGVSVDHISAGLPAIQPRSDEGARLIR